VCKEVRYRVDEGDVCRVPVEAKEVTGGVASSTEAGKEAEKGGKTYAPVTLEGYISALMGEEELEYACPSCGKGVVAVKRSRFASFPDVLVVQARKFQLVNWVPTKLDVPVILPDSSIITLDNLLGTGPQATEELLPEDSSSSSGAAAQLPAFNEAAIPRRVMFTKDLGPSIRYRLDGGGEEEWGRLGDEYCKEKAKGAL